MPGLVQAGVTSGASADFVNHRQIVGAGVLAEAVCQPTLMLNVMAPSRASPLPHLACVSLNVWGDSFCFPM